MRKIWSSGTFSKSYYEIPYQIHCWRDWGIFSYLRRLATKYASVHYLCSHHVTIPWNNYLRLLHLKQNYIKSSSSFFFGFILIPITYYHKHRKLDTRICRCLIWLNSAIFFCVKSVSSKYSFTLTEVNGHAFHECVHTTVAVLWCCARLTVHHVSRITQSQQPICVTHLQHLDLLPGKVIYEL